MHRFRKSKRGQAPAFQEGQDQLLETSGLSPVSPTFPSPSVFQQPLQSPPSPQAQPTSPTPPRVAEEPPSIGPLPRIEPNDFRASVILPEFSQQFPVLLSGAQITLEDLKGRLAEQRARGSANRISEEEEEMILDALRFRSRGSNNSQRPQDTQSPDAPDDQFLTPVSNLTASPSSSRSKRYSNNLFGSGRLRDYTYMRSVTSRSKTSLASSSSTRTASSVTPTESSVAAGRINSIAESTTSSTSLRPTTPEGTTSISSIISSLHSSLPQQEAGSTVGSNTNMMEATEESSVASNTVSAAAAVEYIFGKKMDSATLKRASLALQEAIKELEDEGEDEIVLPRLRTPRGIIDNTSDSRASYSSMEAGVAVTADKQIPFGSEEHRASPLPSRILPGYIPGMNRPMTPRDFDLDDRSHSTTPRATSPVMNVLQADSISSLSSAAPQNGAGLLRKESISAATVRQSPRPGTPSLFLQRSPSANGRHTPEAQEAIRRSTSGGDQQIELESPSHSSLLSRRRPISPLSNLAASASNATAVGSATSSRPSTPSNVIWQPSLSGSQGSSKPMHTRSESWQSDASGNEIIVGLNGVGGNAGRCVSTPPRTVRSPPIQDPTTTGQFTNLGAARVATPPPDRTQVAANGVINNGSGGGDVFSSNRSQRSPTPTPNSPRSPSSPAFGFVNGGSRRSSRQTATSPWGYTSTPYAPPMLNLFGNSSRTSIGSTGSSYHSRDGDKDDRDWYDQILSGEEPPPVWHDLSVGRTESPLSEDVAEELLRKYFGLTITDIAAIQEKLVVFAGSKGDGGRKRRPSTSQSNYVAPARVNSPPPQIVQVPGSSTNATALTSEQYSQKANALLDSVVSDIRAKHPSPPPPPLDTSSAAVRKVTPSDPSPGTKRNHSLADVLFGSHDNRPLANPQSDESEPAPDSSVVVTPIESNQGSVGIEGSGQMLTEAQAEDQTATVSASPSTSSVSQSPQSLSQNSSARVPMSSKNEADLVREFQAKMAQADATLKGASRSHLPGENLAYSGSISRKRIDPSQIGHPQLLSHSNPASLEGLQTIPSRSPSLSTSHNSPTSKIGSRFKKLRGTLRVKHPSPLAEEIAASSASSSSSTPATAKSPVPYQTAIYDPAKLRTPGSPALASATEPGRSRISISSPPASAGPGLKGFISRFRGKQRASEPPPAADKRLSPQLAAHPPPLSPLSPRYQETSNVRTPVVTEVGPGSSTQKIESIRQNTVPSPTLVDPSTLLTHATSSSVGSRQSVMLQQLFDAANNLGLDQNALNDLLMRSGSISTRATKSTRPNLQRSNSRQGQRSESPAALEQSNSGDASQLTVQPPSPVNPRPSQSTPEPGNTMPLVFKAPEQARKARESRGDRAASTVVRRTIILPDSIKVVGADAQSVLHRANSGKRRRASVNSSSIKDRAPTPPPPRSPVSQRFSNDGSPPVPSLPHSLSPDVYLTASRTNMEKPNSTYDSSIYEMYANEGRAPSAVGTVPLTVDNPLGPSQSGPALEFIEYANGETIWSIVSGLRNEEDDESIYNGRTSFASEYSTGPQGGQDWDQVQVTVREHTRSSSRGSYSSFALKSKKEAAAQNKSRPETKVFYGSSAQIGRLIENLSQGMDAGSFNFAPTTSRTGHSASSSVSTTNDISMEDRLEQLLGSLSPNA